MRIQPKTFIVSLALTMLLATSAVAESRAKETGGDISREPNPIVRIIKNIKHRLAQIKDGVILPPPQIVP